METSASFEARSAPSLYPTSFTKAATVKPGRSTVHVLTLNRLAWLHAMAGVPLTKFDHVIVGAGSAGCVLASRLSADGKRKVALLEAGGPHQRTLNVRAPAAWPQLWWGDHDWKLTTEPQPHSDNRKHYWPRGKLLGGTSCLNAMIYIRGHRDNYDEWRDLGNPG